MKKNFLSFTLLLIATSLFISCKKEKTESEPQESITFTIDGVQKVFKVNDSAKVYITDAASMVILNANADSVSPEAITLAILTNKVISAGTYATPGPGSAGMGVTAQYTTGTSGTTLMSGYTTADEGMKITITSLTDEMVTGTFSGIFHDDSDQSKTVTITGSFNLPVSNQH